MEKLVTVFTPVHRFEEKHLTDLYESLAAQSYKNFEWLILLNGDALRYVNTIASLFKEEKRISLYKTDGTGSIGLLKSICCEYARGEYLVEVDYDDMLTPNALEAIVNTLSLEKVQFVYSNSVEFTGNYSEGNSNTYSEVFGWKSAPFENHTQMVAFPPSAHYFRRIEFAPNHVRAFKKEGYNRVGGYDKSIAVGDDHDLVCRFYVEFGNAGFAHINECLYLYRVHPKNTCNGDNRNAEIQAQVDVNYIKWAEKMYLKWASDKNLLSIDLGGRFNCPEGYKSVDLRDADIIMDLTGTWELEDNSVGVLRAYHILEHLPDTIHFFNEAYRVLSPGGFLLIEVPHYLGQGGVSDPTHIKFFTERSFGYYTKQDLAKYIQPQYVGRFQNIRQNTYSWGDGVTVISCHMIALKGFYDDRWCGLKEM